MCVYTYVYTNIIQYTYLSLSIYLSLSLYIHVHNIYIHIYKYTLITGACRQAAAHAARLRPKGRPCRGETPSATSYLISDAR